MPTAEDLPFRLQHPAEQRLGLVGLALVLQLPSERIQGERRAFPIHALVLEPCAQELDAQRIAIPAQALAAAVGCVALYSRAAPMVDAVFVGPLGGAAAGARLHKRAVIFSPEANSANVFLLHHSGVRLSLCSGERCRGRKPESDALRSFACKFSRKTCAQ